MLTNVSFRNLRGLKEVDIPLERFTVFVGTNSSGKTSVLEGIDFLSQLGRPLTDEVEENRETIWRTEVMTDLVRLRSWLTANAEPAELSVSVEFSSQNEIGARVCFRSNEKRTLQRAFLWQKTTESQVTLRLPDQYANAQRFFNMSGYGEFRSTGRLRLEPREMATAAYSDEVTPTLGLRGENLAVLLGDLKMRSNDSIRRIAAALKEVIPSVEAIHVERARVFSQDHPPPKGVIGFSLALEMRGAGVIDAAEVSEGTLLTLGLLTLLESSSRPNLILLDDLDRALHPKAQWDLVACLRRFLEQNSDVQILCTTHSPYLLEVFKPEEIRIMTSNSENYSVCKRLVDHPRWEEFKDMVSPGEFWSDVGESWLLDEEPAE